jgi:hypothetical protein
VRPKRTVLPSQRDGIGHGGIESKHALHILSKWHQTRVAQTRRTLKLIDKKQYRHVIANDGVTGPDLDVTGKGRINAVISCVYKHLCGLFPCVHYKFLRDSADLSERPSPSDDHWLFDIETTCKATPH